MHASDFVPMPLRELRAFQRRRRILVKPIRKHALDAVMRTRTVFVHIPKCGGKTVVSRLYELGIHEYFGHADIAFYKAILGPWRFSSFLKFATVRDPYARTRSAFFFGKSGGFGLKSDLDVQARLTGVDWHHFVMSDMLEHFATTHMTFRPQVSFLMDADDRLQCDFVVPLERLDEGLHHLGLDVSSTAPEALNVAPPRTQSAHEAEERAVIERVYRDDVALFSGALVPLFDRTAPDRLKQQHD